MTDRRYVGLMGAFWEFWGAGRLALSFDVNERGVRQERSTDGFCQGERKVVGAYRGDCRCCPGRTKGHLGVESDKVNGANQRAFRIKIKSRLDPPLFSSGV